MKDMTVTDDEIKRLMEKAVEAQKFSYAPYSHFNVGAALLAEDGSVTTGCNIENAAFGPTCCAERVAIFKAVSCGTASFKAIAIAGGKDMSHEESSPPCGVCRQVMREFCADDFVIATLSGGKIETFTLGELLPKSFGPGMVKS